MNRKEVKRYKYLAKKCLAKIEDTALGNFKVSSGWKNEHFTEEFIFKYLFGIAAYHNYASQEKTEVK